MASHTLHLHIRQAVKADKPERNYITLEQFLAWYLGSPRVTSCFNHGKVTGEIGVVDVCVCVCVCVSVCTCVC